MTGPNGTTVTVIPAAGLPGSLRGALHRLFDQTYAQADHGYLEKSLELLSYVAVAAADDATRQAAAGPSGREQIIGFALGETRILDLPGLPGEPVGLAGLCCVHSTYRRQGLFRTLETRVIADGKIMNGNRGALPRRQIVPTAFQQDVARAVASCLPSTISIRSRSSAAAAAGPSAIRAWTSMRTRTNGNCSPTSTVTAVTRCWHCPGSQTRRPAGERPAHRLRDPGRAARRGVRDRRGQDGCAAGGLLTTSWRR